MDTNDDLDFGGRDGTRAWIYARYAMGDPVSVIAAEGNLSPGQIYAIMREKPERFAEAKKERDAFFELRLNEFSDLIDQLSLESFVDILKSIDKTKQVDFLKKAWAKFVELSPAKLHPWEVPMLENLKKRRFVFEYYKLDFSVNVIAYVAGITEHCVYRILRSNPVAFEKAKAARTTKMKKSHNEPYKS
ncbi:MAG: hypothetical protein JW715_09290 [Sedimentisphaerales bacterium]|nr:hypothetical protein [Sedimentisphaerales bacterium]